MNEFQKHVEFTRKKLALDRAETREVQAELLHTLDLTPWDLEFCIAHGVEFRVGEHNFRIVEGPLVQVQSVTEWDYETICSRDCGDKMIEILKGYGNGPLEE